MSKYLLKLYIAGPTIRSRHAITNIRRICEECLDANYELAIVDIINHPQVAEDERILATPTLVRESPPPPRRIIGDLSDTDKVLQALEL